MGNDRQIRRSRWRLPRALGAAVLTAGVLAAALPTGTALASPAAAAAPVYSLDALTHVTALGHTWSLDMFTGDGSVTVALSTTIKGVSETHTWMTTSGFTAAARKDLKVTSTGHATFSTGSALSPVLGVSLSFAPTKVTKLTCTKGSESTYTEKVTGSLSLATGLRGVKESVRFSGQGVGLLDVDRSCVLPVPKTALPCTGGNWTLGGGNPAQGSVLGAQFLGPKSPWEDIFGLAELKTASKWLTRSVNVSVNGGPAPKLNTAAKTVALNGLASGGVTGAAVMSYSSPFSMPPVTCLVGSKKFKQINTFYLSSKVAISKQFQAHSLLAGSLTMHGANSGTFVAVKLTAA
jgi:hypothetical protein